ncbi:MAG: N-acetylmuramoyl-L-alanine amidase [Solirubrobacterales bacterium]|jgi:N-acetylmuramoyl-L-alanine amidase|nr:N-acetylmuramoyl-L-alanine amidase [Solirubrobacterales bacterium]
MKRRWVVPALSALGAVAMVSGCGGGGEVRESTVGTTASGERQGITRASTTPAEASPPHHRASAPPAASSNSSADKKPWQRMPPATVAPKPESKRQGLPLSGLTISVDPGHNGGNFTHPEEIGRSVPAGVNGTTKPCNTTGTATDDGALTEAQFNWDVAEDIVPRLEGLGATVVLTRHSNGGVGPCVDERAEIANRAHAAVALSIHADGNEAAGAHGFDVIHASTTEMVDPSMAGPSLKLAEAERDALVGAGVPPANYVGEDGLDARSDLAGLNLARVPAVLVELGNMRDAEEAGKLEDPAYRRKLADALVTGIVAFLGRS